MKRVVLPLLVAALVLILAVPAGANGEAITYHWGTYVGGPDPANPPDITADLADYFGRVPQVGDRMALGFGWITYGRGRAQSFPKAITVALWIDGPAGFHREVTGSDTQQYWLPPRHVPDFREEGWPPFNRKIGADPWLAFWAYDDPDELGFALEEPGVYTVHWFDDFNHVTTDLFALAGEDGEPLDKFAGFEKYRPGDGALDVYFTFTVEE